MRKNSALPSITASRPSTSSLSSGAPSSPSSTADAAPLNSARPPKIFFRAGRPAAAAPRLAPAAKQAQGPASHRIAGAAASTPATADAATAASSPLTGPVPGVSDAFQEVFPNASPDSSQDAFVPGSGLGTGRASASVSGPDAGRVFGNGSRRFGGRRGARSRPGVRAEGRGEGRARTELRAGARVRETPLTVAALFLCLAVCLALAFALNLALLRLPAAGGDRNALARTGGETSAAASATGVASGASSHVPFAVPSDVTPDVPVARDGRSIPRILPSAERGGLPVTSAPETNAGARTGTSVLPPSLLVEPDFAPRVATAPHPAVDVERLLRALNGQGGSRGEADASAAGAAQGAATGADGKGASRLLTFPALTAAARSSAVNAGSSGSAETSALRFTLSEEGAGATSSASATSTTVPLGSPSGVPASGESGSAVPGTAASVPDASGSGSGSGAPMATVGEQGFPRLSGRGLARALATLVNASPVPSDRLASFLERVPGVALTASAPGQVSSDGVSSAAPSSGAGLFVFTQPDCPHCVRTQRLLLALKDRLSFPVVFFPIGHEASSRALYTRPGRRLSAAERGSVDAWLEESTRFLREISGTDAPYVPTFCWVVDGGARASTLTRGELGVLLAFLEQRVAPAAASEAVKGSGSARESM